MSCKMAGYPLGYLANSSYLGQIFVHLLVADDWQKFAVFCLAFVFGKYFQRDRQQGDKRFHSGLPSVLHNPLLAVHPDLDVFCGQRIDVAIRQTGVTTEDEGIAYLFQAFRLELLVVNRIYFLLRQIAPVGLVEVEAEIPRMD